MSRYDISVLGYGDNVVDKYEHIRTMYPGGNAVNFAVYARMFGAGRSAYMGYFGNDAEAEHVIASLAAEGLETFKCRQLIGENGCARATVRDGDRIFLGSNEGGIRGDRPHVLDRFDIEYVKTFDLVHSGNYCFTERQLPKIKAAGVTVSFDFSDDSTPDYYERIAPMVDYAFMSMAETPEDEVRSHLERVVGYGPSLACASRGADGCLAYDGHEYYYQTAKPVEKLADTMGAGDALLTVFLVHHLAGRKQGHKGPDAIRRSLDEAATFAATVCGIDGAWGYGATY